MMPQASIRHSPRNAQNLCSLIVPISTGARMWDGAMSLRAAKPRSTAQGTPIPGMLCSAAWSTLMARVCIPSMNVNAIKKSGHTWNAFLTASPTRFGLSLWIMRPLIPPRSWMTFGGRTELACVLSRCPHTVLIST